jgi:tetratricopeptide repeat protein 21B
MVKAQTVQNQVLAVMRRDAPDLLTEQRVIAAELSYELGRACEEASPPRDDDAANVYKEALRANDAHAPTLLALARLHLRRGQLDDAQARA